MTIATLLAGGALWGQQAQPLGRPGANARVAWTAPRRRAERVKPNYQLASEWTEAKVNKLVFSTSVMPHWFTTSDKFWYSYKTDNGTAYYVVDPAKGTKAALFDHIKLAEKLTALTGIPYDGEHLPLQHMRLVDGDTALRFSLSVKRTAVIPGLAPETEQQEQVENAAQKKAQKGTAASGPATTKGPSRRDVYFQMNLGTQQVQLLGNFHPPLRQPRWAQVSPNRQWVVFARHYNLYMMDAASYALALKNPNDPNIKETQLTTDGVEWDGYESHPFFGPTDQDLGHGSRGARRLPGVKVDHSKNPRKPAVRVVWSADSSKFALEKTDERKVGDLWVIHTLHQPRPTLETYKYPMPGEKNMPQDSMMVFDVKTQQHVTLDTARFVDQHMRIQYAPRTHREAALTPQGSEPAAIWLGGNADKLYFFRQSRDFHKLDYCVANTVTGAVKPIIEERSNVYIMTKPLRLVDHGQDLLVWSERNGWAHYYRYGIDGTLKNQIDHGQFMAGNIEAVDDTTGTMYFTANGYKAGENTYYQHLYRIGLNGEGMRAIDASDANHRVEASDDGKYFVDTYSRVDTAPVSELLGDNGKLLHLQTTDVKALLAAGYQFPTPFHVKAADGMTDLYGVMFKPFDFNPHLQYPLIEYVYPGPQTEEVDYSFDPATPHQTMAQFGFIVIEIGNRGGSPLRDEWYHTFGYGNMRDYGLADKKQAAEELAQRYPFIDIKRVGINGHSGGGFMSAAAILEYPEFFKVAVAESGNYDNRIYNNTWSEERNGIQEIEKDGKTTFQYHVGNDEALAANLQGHLMLATGDMDSNVSYANSMRLVNALIRANKRFAFVILPGERHHYGSDTDWFFWRKAGYFCQWLLGSSPHGANMFEMQKAVQQDGGGRG
ncbi:MAG: DPP IV N-terminal domain-containing protein [Terriglobales bacterium]